MAKKILQVTYNGLEKTEMEDTSGKTFEQIDADMEQQFRQQPDNVIIERFKMEGMRGVMFRNKARKIIKFYKEISA